jgi:hypothetical protein
MRSALAGLVEHGEGHESIAMDLPLTSSVHVVEVSAVVDDAANPQSGAELGADVAAVLEALESPREDFDAAGNWIWLPNAE